MQQMPACGVRGNPWLCSGSHLPAPQQPLSSGRGNDRKPPSCLCLCFVSHQGGLNTADGRKLWIAIVLGLLGEM